MEKKLRFEWDDKIPKDWREKFSREVDSTLEIYYRAINTLKVGRIKYNLFGVIGHIIVEEIEEEITTANTSEVLKTSEVCHDNVETPKFVSPDCENQKCNPAKLNQNSCDNSNQFNTSEVLKTSEVCHDNVETPKFVSPDCENQKCNPANLNQNSCELSNQSNTSEVLETSEVNQELVETQTLVALHPKEMFCSNFICLYMILMEIIGTQLIKFLRFFRVVFKLKHYYNLGIGYLIPT